MANKFKLALVATISVISSSISAASAQELATTLTYEEFAATTNHQEMSLAMENFYEELRSGKKMNLTSVLRSDLGSTAIGLTKLNAVTSGRNFKYRQSNMNLLSPSSSAGETTVKDYGLKNGLYFGTIATYAANSFNFKASTLKRLGKPKATHYTTRNGSLLQFINPMDSASVIYSSSLSMATWNALGNVTDNPEARFSNVEKSPNPKNPNNTDYTFDLKVPSTMSSDDFTRVHTIVTISGDGKTYSAKSESEMPYFSLGIITSSATTAITLSPSTIVVPNLKSVVNLQSLVDLSYRIMLEDSLVSLANYVVTKATALAAKAKKSLAISHLIAAAKTLPYKYTMAKGVIKLSQQWQGMKVNACISMANKKAVVKVC